MPRMIAVQSDGCAPIVKAWEEGADHAEFWENAETEASGIRVPSALGDFLILRALRESGGFAIAVSDEDILRTAAEIGHRDGLLMCPEGAATAAANCFETDPVLNTDVVLIGMSCSRLAIP